MAEPSREITGGHRYYYLMCLVIYACKCDVPKEKLKADMYEVFDKLKLIEHDNPLTEEDVESALEYIARSITILRFQILSI
mgnify:CR=1 FL=1